ncbi:MAG: zinc ABC transporter substrate-binding protein [Clostridia bacterium]|nr:zinc ABC transporter substrate-binding protein [Clostridia bacterium]
MKHRIVCLIITAALAALILSGCGATQPPAEAPDDPTTRVMASFYPIYALTLPVATDVPDLTVGCLTQPQNGCPRRYTLSDWDAAILAAQDGVIIGGRGFETFESALTGLKDEGPALLIAFSGLTLINGGPANDESTHFEGDNPWLFLSVSGAKEIVISLASGLAQLDEAYASAYYANMDATLKRLDELDARMREALSGVPRQPVALLHEGLIYLAEDLGLEVACQVPREPGTDQIGNDLDALLEALDAGGARVALVERQVPMNLCDALEENGYIVCRIDTLMTHAADGDADAYFDIMYDNALSVADALARADEAP